MGLSIKKDIATSLTSLIFVVIIIGGFLVSFPFLELSLKKIFFLFGIVFIFSIILNFTKRRNYLQKNIFAAAILIASGFFLNTPNSNILYEKFASPIEKEPIENTFVILSNNINLVKNTSNEASFELKPIS